MEIDMGDTFNLGGSLTFESQRPRVWFSHPCLTFQPHEVFSQSLHSIYNFFIEFPVFVIILYLNALIADRMAEERHKMICQ